MTTRTYEISPTKLLERIKKKKEQYDKEYEQFIKDPFNKQFAHNTEHISSNLNTAHLGWKELLKSK